MVTTRRRPPIVLSSSLSTLGDALSQSLKRAREEEEEEEERLKEAEVNDSIEDVSMEVGIVREELGTEEGMGSASTLKSEAEAVGPSEEEEAQLKRQDTYKKLMVLAAGRSQVRLPENATASGSGVNSTSSGEVKVESTQGVELEEPGASGVVGKRTPAMIAERKRIAEEIRDEKLAQVRRFLLFPSPS